MRKFYSLLAVVALTGAFNAQTTVLSEDFTAYSAGGNTASSGAGSADSKDVYAEKTNVPTFPTGTKVYSAGGMAKLGTGSLVGTMTTGALDLTTDGGSVRVTFDVKGWSTIEGPMVVSLDGVSKEVTYTALMSGTELNTVSVEFPSAGTATSKVTIATKVKRAYVDNVTIVTYDKSLAVGDVNASKVNLVKNTVVSNEIIFGAAAKVNVYNMAGQIVKTADVVDNSRLDVSGLSKGTYVVSGTVNGKAVSTKIIKK